MTQSCTLKININKDDQNLNDYLQCWDILGERPSRINLFQYYNVEGFMEMTAEATTISSQIDMLPSGEDYIVNEKCLVKYSDGVFISYIHIDKLVEESMIGEVTIIFNQNQIGIVDTLIDDLESLILDFTHEDSNHRINSLSLGANGLELESIELLKINEDSFEDYYEEGVVKQADKLVKSLKKTNKGLTIIHGPRGTGKTNLASYIASNIDKVVIFVSCAMIETLMTADFKQFIKRHKNSLLILDDAEAYFSELHFNKANIFSSNLLQFVDGFQSDNWNLNILLILNLESVDDADHILFECNNLVDAIEVGELNPKKATELSKKIGENNKYKESAKLIQVLKPTNKDKKENKIGF